MTDEGFMLVPATISRIGIQEYNAGDIDMEGVPANTRVRVYRPPNEVFDQESMNSFALKPVTNGHPSSGLVNIDNIKKYQVGNAGSRIERSGDMTSTDLLITDKAMITAIENGKCEISNGYVADFDYTSGTTEAGEHYDATMKNIRGNHIAIVDQARGGRGLRLSDEHKQEHDMKKIMFDGIEIEVTDQGEQAIGKLGKEKKEVQDGLDAAKAELVTQKASHDTAIAVKDQEIADAKALIVDGAELDAIIEQRGQVITDAKALHKEVETAGKTNAQIIESVVVHLCDGIDLGAKSDEYCSARFDALLEVRDSATDGHEKVVVGDEDDDTDAGEVARQKHKKDSETAYMSKKEGE
jgi:hypothetical protein